MVAVEPDTEHADDVVENVTVRPEGVVVAETENVPPAA
jgi:hypothetical protein